MITLSHTPYRGCLNIWTVEMDPCAVTDATIEAALDSLQARFDAEMLCIRNKLAAVAADFEASQRLAIEDVALEACGAL